MKSGNGEPKKRFLKNQLFKGPNQIKMIGKFTVRKLLHLFILIFTPLFLQGQFEITGIVVDNYEDPLLFANIIEKGTTNGTASDLEGKFTLDVKEFPSIIQVSYLGYVTREIKVNESVPLRIVLETELLGADEIVVTALGLERSSKALGYSVQKLNPNELQEVKAVNFLDNLSGKLAGVTVSQGATGVGSSTKITIRGESSFTNNNPLFVVDGVPINNNTILNVTNEAAAGFQEIDFGNGAMEVNPDDVAEVSVLKGPSAAALYGTRAANGVVIINTKDGKNSKGMGISINSSIFIDRPFQLPEFQNKYGQGNSGEFEFVDGLGGGTNDNITYSYGPELDAGLFVAQFDSPVTLTDGTTVRAGDIAVHGGAAITPSPFVSRPNNLRNFYETGLTTINNIAISGGSYEKGNYRLSLTNLNSDSYIPGVNLKRNTVATKMGFKPTDKLSVSTSLNYINSQSDNRPANGYGSENINYSLVAWMGRQTDLEVMKDYWQPGLEGTQQYSFNYTFFDNPYFILLENRNAFNRDRVFGNVATRYDFSDNFALTLRTGMDYSDELRTFRRGFSTNRFKNGAYAEHDVFYREMNSDFLFDYQRDLGDFGFNVLLGGNRMGQKAYTKQTQALSLAQPGVFKLSNAASPLEIFDFESTKRINSLYGLLKLNYSNFLYLDVTGRNDWSSALATPNSTENVSFFYPSISASWVLSNLADLPDVFSFAKLRASWAQVGNDTSPFQTTGVFQAQTPYNGQPTFGDQSFIPNAKLLPEQSTSVEVGADLRFFDDRLKVDITHYNALTENQILSLPIALSSGYDEQVLNGGAVRSKGWEILLGLSPVVTTKYRWKTQFNFSRNVSIVESLPEETERLTLAYTRVYDNVNQTVWYQVREGDQIGDMWGTGYLKNANGDFVIGDDGRYIVDNTLKKLGNYNPDFILGWYNEVKVQNLDVSFLFDWRQGGELISRTQALAGVAGQLLETENRPVEGIVAEGVVNLGTETEPNYVPNTTAIPAESYYRQFYDRNHEENNTYDASYLKLRELSIGYTFGNQKENFLGNIESIRLSLLARNLFALSDIPHFDPEQLAVQGNTFVSGVEDMSYPTARSFGVSLGIDF